MIRLRSSYVKQYWTLYKIKEKAIFLIAAWQRKDRNQLTFKSSKLMMDFHWLPLFLVQFSSSVMSDSLRPMDYSTPGLPVHHQLPEFIQTHVHWVGDATQPSHPLSSPSPPALNLSQHQGLFQWVSSLHQVAKGLEFQLQHQSFQWIYRTDL